MKKVKKSLALLLAAVMLVSEMPYGMSDVQAQSQVQQEEEVTAELPEDITAEDIVTAEDEAQDPATKDDETQEPVAENDVTEEPVTEDDEEEEPVTDNNEAEDPATVNPATEGPVAVNPATANNATETSEAEDIITEEEAQEIPSATVIHVNPVYAGEINEEDLKTASDNTSAALAEEGMTYHGTVKEAGAQLRGAMVERNSTVTIGYQMTGYTQEAAEQILNDVVKEAVKHTKNPKEGDYLKWQYTGFQGNIEGEIRDGVAYLIFTYTFTYCTDAAKEAEMDQTVDSLLQSLALEGKTEYEKVKAIYDYICGNVSYNDANGQNTAYGALKNKTASALGYSLLFYRLTLEEGIDARVIGGTPHAWNIVKIGNLYYNLDAAQDAGKLTHSYFLKGKTDFTGYEREEEYSTDAFTAEYPMAESSYVPGDTPAGDEIKLSAVELQISDVTNTQIELSWTKNEGADGYIIYAHKGNTKTQVKTIISNATLSNRITGLTPSTFYAYTVVPYKMVDSKLYEGAPSVKVLAKTKALTAVTLQAEATDYKEVKLTWTKNQDADGYKIYRKNSGGVYVLYKTITSGSTLSFTDNSLSFNKFYAYKIAPYKNIGGKAYIGNMSAAVLAKTRLMAPKISTVKEVNYKTLEVTWSSVNGATGYEIFRSTSENGTYKIVGRVASKTVLSYKDATAIPNQISYYKVRPYLNLNGTRVYGSFSNVKKGMTYLAKVTNVKATAVDYTTIKLSWNKVSEATKYQICYSTSPDSGYKLLATVDTTSYTWKKPTCGQTYYFLVRAVRVQKDKKFVGVYSDAVSAKTMIGKPTPTAEKKNYNTIKISWKKVTGAEQYEIYWSETQVGNYKRLVATSDTSYEHTGRTVGKTYYYKVRSIRQSSFSNFSGAVSAKTSLGSITGLKAEKYTTNSIKVSWNAADGATRYDIYRSESKNGTYTFLGTLATTSYIDQGVKLTKVYYYKVIGTRGTESTPPAIVSTGTRSTAKGVDVSEHQGEINWKKVSEAGIDFAMLRILKGKTSEMQPDAQFESYYSGARRYGLSVGVYRYCYATSVSEAKKEAKKVLEVLDGRYLDYPVVLDMEDSSLLSLSKSQRSEIVLAFKKVIEDAGYDFALYANMTWLNNYLDMNKLSDVNIWLARWRDYEQGPGYTGPGNLIMWQYTNDGKVNGITGRVDLNVSYF